MQFNYKNLKINYEIYGEGQPMLFIHGLGCDMGLMKGCSEPIFTSIEGYQRFYIDLPGMGKSDSDLSFASTDLILEVVLAFAREIIAKPFLLVGESFGGYLSQAMLTKLESQIISLFLLCPVAVAEKTNRNLPEKIETFYDHAFLEQLSHHERNNFTFYGVICNESTYKRYQKSIVPGLSRQNEEFIDLLERNYSLSNSMESVHFAKPVTILCGRQDNCVGYHDQFQLLEKYPRGEFIILDKAGHNLQIEQVEQFENSFKNWLLRSNS